jgi:hypothetical protein
MRSSFLCNQQRKFYLALVASHTCAFSSLCSHDPIRFAHFVEPLRALRPEFFSTAKGAKESQRTQRHFEVYQQVGIREMSLWKEKRG